MAHDTNSEGVESNSTKHLQDDRDIATALERAPLGSRFRLHETVHDVNINLEVTKKADGWVKTTCLCESDCDGGAVFADVGDDVLCFLNEHEAMRSVEYEIVGQGRVLAGLGGGA